MKTKNYFKKAAILVLVCFTQFIMAQVPSYVPTNGLKAYYPFNGNANDASGNANNGTVNGATLTTDRFGNSNNAYSFDGVSNNIKINYPIFSQTPCDGDWTISFWYKLGAPLNTLSSFVIFSNVGNVGLQEINPFGNWDGSNPLYGYWWKKTKISTVQTNFDNNVWYHFTYTYSHSTNSMKVFINGTDNSGSSVDMTSYGGSASNLGNWNVGSTGYPNQFFKGKVDDIGMWNRVLTQAEITTMYNGVASYTDNCNAVSGSLTQGLVGYWPFCGNANDDSGHGNNGTINGATSTTDRFGNSNAAYNFNGTSSYIEIPHSTSLNFGTQDFTISAWAKPSQFQSNDQHIVSKERSLAPDNNQFRMAIAKSTNPSDKHYYFASAIPPAPGYGLNWTSATGYVLQSNSIAPITTWSHITIVRTGATYKLYINGILNSTDNTINGLVQDYSLNLQNLIFGAQNQTTGTGKQGFFNGIIDDIGFWNRALTTQEITQLFNQNQCFTNTTVTDTLIINVGQLSYTNPIAYANNITIYPNPASTQINITFNNISDLNGGSIKIINSLGQQVTTTPITSTGTNSTMILSSWGGTGLYFVQIVNPQGQIVDIKKIILQ
jgi:hypothetical protein